MSGITIYVLIVIFLATLIRSAFGFGEALVAVPLLALRIPFGIAVPLSVLVSIFVAAIVVVQDWKKIHFRSAGWLVFFTLLGIPLGLFLLIAGNEQILKSGLGLLIIAFSVYSLFGKKEYSSEIRQHDLAFRMRISCRRFWRSLWTERATSGSLRNYATLVGPAFPGNFTGIFSSGQFDCYGRILV